ncbi:protocadherin-20-like isoform X2 [Ascaphus truei]|uniref:protocadherin-20-like isoform X2 n=1 Tax=Ascaphus truei TaxID=8439 RepID=UPI003F5A5C14
MENVQKYLSILLIIFHNPKPTTEATFHILEEQQEGTFIGSIRNNLTLNAPYKLEFNLLDKSLCFHLDQESGDLYTTATKLDRESLCPHDVLDQCVVAIDAIISSEEHYEIEKITVFILDINDNAPYFSEKNIILSISEDTAVGTMFAIDHLASDADTGSSSALTYHLNCPDGVFILSHHSELISLMVQKPLDRELQREYIMNLVASDQGLPPLSGSTTLIVEIMDVNDNCPIFLTNYISLDLPRNFSVNRTVVQLLAVDEDAGENNIIQYVYSNRVPDASKQLFTLYSTTGVIRLSTFIHEDTPNLHKLTILAIGPGCVPAVAIIAIFIEESRSKAPRMEFLLIASQVEEVVSIKEDVPLNTIIAILEITDPDHSILRPVYINGTSPFFLKPSENTPDRYLLVTHAQLDFELEQKYDIHVVGNDTLSPTIFYDKTLSIKIEDVNDNFPQFSQNILEIYTEENNNPGDFLLKLSASDADSGFNGKLCFDLEEGTPSAFAIDKASGILTTSVSFDREEEASYTFLVIASDYGSPSKNNTCTVVINILDQNDNAPVFPMNEFNFYIPEDLPRRDKVGIINVTDADFGSNCEFSVSLLNATTLFSIDQDSIILRSEGSLDYEREFMYELWIEAKDKESNFSYVLVPPDTSKGSSIAKVHAIDYDAGMNGVITYSGFGEMGPSANLFMIDALTGNITLKESINGHHCGLYQLLVKASDHGHPDALSTIVRVNILLNHSIGNRSYLESLITEKATLTKENQVTMLSPCPQYRTMAQRSWFLTAPAALACVVGMSAVCSVTGMFLFWRTRRIKAKNKKKPDVEVPLQVTIDYSEKDWGEIK